METLKIEICHYFNCESHIYLGVLRKTNAKNNEDFGCLAELLHATTMRMRMQNASGAVGVFIRSVFSTPSDKILDKNCESLH